MDPGTKDRLFRIGTSLHRAIFAVTQGRLLGKMAGMPVVLLTTTGRRSGAPRQTMLTTPLQMDGRIVLVASYGGDRRHPAWFLNLRENPDVIATMAGRTQKMRARVAPTEEKAELWPKVTSRYRGYAGYQKRTDRDIPLVILEPA
jgi:deazaflavin-dependent oxidoreductase (nitroreductase family)